MKVSVCIATYNGEKYLKEQLESIICQLKENDEVVISDNGSTDSSFEIIKKLKDPRINLIQNPKSGLNCKNNRSKFYSVTNNFENALNNCNGDIIFLSDQDDVWSLHKVSDCLSVFEQTNTALILHDAQVVDNAKNIIADSYFKLIGSKKGIIRNLIKNSYLGCCMVFKRNVLDIALPFPKKLIAHDIWLGLVAEGYFNVYFLERQLLQYRRHDLNVSQSAGKSSNSFFFKIEYRSQLVKDLLKKKWSKKNIL